MARTENQKRRLLCLLDLLYRETDADHRLSLAEMQAGLEKAGYSVERKALYDDLRALADHGVALEYAARRGYAVVSRTYEPAELKMLVDIISSAKFLTAKKSRELIRKLSGETSRYGAEALNRQVYTSRARSQSEVIYYTVDALHTAIRENRQVSFRYCHYNARKVRGEKSPGLRYVVSPWALLWDNENYYLVAYDDEAKAIRHYRVDRMRDVCAEKQKRLGKAAFGSFDIGAYESKTFGMFGGEEETVTLACTARAADAIIDRFGTEPTFIPDGDGFDVTVRVFQSPQFYAWLTGLAGLVRLKAPARAVEAYRAYLTDALEKLQ